MAELPNIQFHKRKWNFIVSLILSFFFTFHKESIMLATFPNLNYMFGQLVFTSIIIYLAEQFYCKKTIIELESIFPIDSTFMINLYNFRKSHLNITFVLILSTFVMFLFSIVFFLVYIEQSIILLFFYCNILCNLIFRLGIILSIHKKTLDFIESLTK